MFKTIITAASVLASVTAFAPVQRSSRAASSQLAMSAESLPGALPPMGFFDPLGLSNDKSPAEMKKIREAELKHGRVAMLAAAGILTGENFNPLFDGKITGAAIYHFQQADNLVSYFWVAVLFGVALIEGQNILDGWESAAETNARSNGVANLKEDYVNGDLGFDPLGLKPSSQDEFDTMRTKELQNGRLAMIGVAGMVAQELVNGQPIIGSIN